MRSPVLPSLLILVPRLGEPPTHLTKPYQLFGCQNSSNLELAFKPKLRQLGFGRLELFELSVEVRITHTVAVNGHVEISLCLEHATPCLLHSRSAFLVKAAYLLNLIGRKTEFGKEVWSLLFRIVVNGIIGSRRLLRKSARAGPGHADQKKQEECCVSHLSLCDYLVARLYVFEQLCQTK